MYVPASGFIQRLVGKIGKPVSIFGFMQVYLDKPSDMVHTGFLRKYTGFLR